MDLKRLSSLLLIAPLLRGAVAVHTVTAGTPWRRSCDDCGEPFSVFRPSRVAGPTGRCGACGTRIGAPPFLVEVAAAVALVGILLALGRLSIVETLAVAWWVGWSIPLAFVDAAVHRLPERLAYPAAVGVATVLALAVATGQPELGQLARALAAGLGTAVVFAVLTFALGRLGPGLGDAKLMLSTATLLGWFGWEVLAVGLAAGLVFQGLLATGILLTGRSKRITHVPMGPFLIGGAAAAIAIAS